MSKRSQDKRKARAKEKAKQARRERGRSLWDNLVSNEGGNGGGGVECWKQFDPEKLDEMEDFLVFRKVRSGGWVVAFFLVDYLCIGLKDVFCRTDVTPSEIIERCRTQSGMKVQRVSVEEVRSTLAAAVRWTQENDFRLPTELPRALKVLGGGALPVDDANTPPLTAVFGTDDGGLCYVGLKHDLKKRLIHETLDEFLARPDVTVDFRDADASTWHDDEKYDDDDDEYDDDELDDDITQAAGDAVQRVITRVKKWCAESGQQPHPYLKEAILLTMMAMAQNLKDGDGETIQETQKRLLAVQSEEMQRELPAALQQFADFTNASKNREDADIEDAVNPND
ncbi:MAG: hypothetical protein FWD53_01770 [Phycisphaerales bacterium]|nr:hypothetical protein [Phycisphaerales bacterium]